MSNKRGLLQRDQEFIELQEIHPTFNDKHKYQRYEPEDQKYRKLEAEQPIAMTQNQRRKLQEMPPVLPYDSKIITMNGQTFKRIDNETEKNLKPKKASIPTMLVSCFDCQTVQSVPGISTNFMCGLCNTPNECLPSHGILRCYSCQTKVLYSKGKGHHTKCTKCNTINEIPLEIKEGWGKPSIEPVFYLEEKMETPVQMNPYISKGCEPEYLSQSDSLGYPNL